MSGFQVPNGFNFGMAPGGYGDPNMPVDYSLQLGGYGAGGNGLSIDPSLASRFGAAPVAAGAPGGFLDNFLSKTDSNGVTAQGWGMPALGVANGLLNAFMGMKQYGIAKDTLAEGKRQFQLNYDAQRTTTNSALEDRQRARVASNPGAYQSVGEYMATNGIRG